MCLLYVVISGEDELQAILKFKYEHFLNMFVQGLDMIVRNDDGGWTPTIYAYRINRDEIEEASEYDIGVFNFEGRRVVVKNRSNLKDLIAGR